MFDESKNIIPNYEITRKLGESSQAIVYKAFHKKYPDKPLVLKMLKAGGFTERQELHFRQKIEQLKVLDDPLFIKPFAFVAKDDFPFIIKDYYDGIPLDSWAEAKANITLDDFFCISCFLAQALQKVHEAGIIHGGVKPHNILVNPETLEVRLIDFISFLDVKQVSHFIYERSFVEATLAYTSPEQTGRINHRVDFSSDLYSLGIVFYELLTRKLPFFSRDPLELIHLHLAEEAAEVGKINPAVPNIIGKIVAKLICKQPEKRYQSGAGLFVDLEQCRNEYSAKKTVSDFLLGRYDFTHIVIFISKMVGRDSEARLILEEYNQAAGGNFRSLFISGLPGIGKTRLIQELQKPIIEHRGYFTSGKFNLYQKNIPYSALIHSLRNLIRTFLTESNERVEAWKKTILEALDNKGKVITEVIPELEILVGSQPEVMPLPPVESKNRFNDLFGRFLTCLASEENPLTIFIDDLQWCDTATFDFLGNIFANYKEHKYLFFIGAYRHNEVNSTHPLTKLIRDIKKDKWPLKEIALGPLDSKHCYEMVSYILDSTLSQTEELSAFIAGLSEGNPLFVSEILSYLHNENLLFWDEKRHWKWDFNRIRTSDMPSTVVALFSSKVQKLPPQTIELLEYCACMGNCFSPTEIALIKEITLFNTFEALKPALAQGLLMESKDDLQFVHDRVQEAVLSAIPEDKRRRIHWNIGNHLSSIIPQGADLEKLDNLFAIAAHLNLGRPEALDAETLYRLSDINYHAGNKALEALAMESANNYFQLARELLPQGCWQKQYEMTFKIYRKAAKAELICGNYANSEKLLNKLLENAKTDLDKAEALAEQTSSLSSIGNFISAVETANQGLACFNKSIPCDSVEAEQKRESLMNKIESMDIDIWKTIMDMPFTHERKSKIESAFYSELIPDLYMSGLVPQLYLSAVQSTQHCLAGGMDESVIYSFAIMALYLGETGEFEKAFRYEDLACNLSAKYPNTFGATRGMNGIVWCNMHSRSHPQDIVAYCLKSIQCGKNSGDLYNAGLSYGPLMWNLQVQGADFLKIEEYAEECFEFSKKYHLNFSVRLAEAMQAGWIEPMKKDYTLIPMDEKIKLWEKDNHIASAGSYYAHTGLVHYYLGDYEKAESYLQGVKKYLTGLTDNVLKRQWHVFLVLNALRLHERGLKYQDKAELLAYINPLIKKFETWAELGPLLKPYLFLVYAEMERVTGDMREARNLYFDAISLAHQYQYVFMEGYLNECLGEFIKNPTKDVELCAHSDKCDKKKPHCDKWWICVKTGVARVFFREAARLYKNCRAQRKEMILQEKYPEYFEEESPVFSPAEKEATSAFSNIDIDYLMKSSLIIPAEIEEDALLHKIMNVVLESSGAQHGYMIIADNGNLIIRAESHIMEKNTVHTTNKDLVGSKDICHAIVRYVYRTKERVIIENASERGEFKDNSEVQALKLRSILCLPVIKQNKLIGILYLENSLAEGVFTAERTALTELFTFQAAISLENARLVEKMKQTEAALERHREHLEEMVEERSRQLRKTQENLLIAERLAVLGQLAGSISHEIRNPLNVISSSAYYLKLKLGDTDKKQREHIERIESEVKNSTIIIDSLLSLSGMKEPHKKRLNLVNILNDAIAVSAIPETVKVVKNIKIDEIFLNADKGQLHIVFNNIIKNAVEAMDKKGTLTVELDKEENKQVKITFIDTGIGICPEKVDSLFKPFFTTKPQGIGFGLSICKMIIEKHKGTITLKPNLDKGTVVVILLPLGNA
ncbi:MAG: AAA family ATPase [Candidatus Omnitrophica bacterium]|nr:AAA family ATPase [Candidatus Omnitrophota bacterium]MBU4478604.1 AAA family ATPase [Candidatus Omnitrophota bacterium]